MRLLWLGTYKHETRSNRFQTLWLPYYSRWCWEVIRKLLVLWCFQRVHKENITLKWVKTKDTKKGWSRFKDTTQLTFTCSKSTKDNTRKTCKICSKVTTKTPKRHRRRSGVVIVTSEHILHLFLVFPFLTLNK